MRVRSVKPHEIPLHLLRQKKQWNLEVFYEFAVMATDWWAFVIEENGFNQPVAAIILTDNRLYDSVAAQTLIVDKPLRTKERVANCIRIGYALSEELARKLGRNYVGSCVKESQTFLEALKDVEGIWESETLLKKEV